MRTFEVYDSNGHLFAEDKIYTAETGRKALDQHLKAINYTGKVKVSADNIVRFKVTPVVIENGKKYIDRRSRQRAMWYKEL